MALCSLSTSAPGPAHHITKSVITVLLHNSHYIQQNKDNTCTNYDQYILHHSKHITQQCCISIRPGLSESPAFIVLMCLKVWKIKHSYMYLHISGQQLHDTIWVVLISHCSYLAPPWKSTHFPLCNMKMMSPSALCETHTTSNQKRNKAIMVQYKSIQLCNFL